MKQPQQTMKLNQKQLKPNQNNGEAALAAHITLPLLTISNNTDVIIDLLRSTVTANIALPLIFLWVFLALFMLYNIFFSFTAILLITEAAMLTLILLLTVSVTEYFPSLTADILNLLNASAMEAIIGITTAFVHQKSWKSRYTNSANAVLESSLFSFYILLIFVGHVGWSIFYTVTALAYYWTKSVFKSTVKQIKILYNFSKYTILSLFKVINFCEKGIQSIWDYANNRIITNKENKKQSIAAEVKYSGYMRKSLFCKKFENKIVTEGRGHITANPYKISGRKLHTKKISLLKTIKCCLLAKKIKVNCALDSNENSRIVTLALVIILICWNQLNIENFYLTTHTDFVLSARDKSINSSLFSQIDLGGLNSTPKNHIELLKKNENLSNLANISFLDDVGAVLDGRKQNISQLPLFDLITINPKNLMIDLFGIQENSINSGMSLNKNIMDRVSFHEVLWVGGVQKALLTGDKTHEVVGFDSFLSGNFINFLDKKDYIKTLKHSNLKKWMGYETKVAMESSILDLVNEFGKNRLNFYQNLKLREDLLGNILYQPPQQAKPSNWARIDGASWGGSNDYSFFYKNKNSQVVSTFFSNDRRSKNRLLYLNSIVGGSFNFENTTNNFGFFEKQNSLWGLPRVKQWDLGLRVINFLNTNTIITEKRPIGIKQHDFSFNHKIIKFGFQELLTKPKTTMAWSEKNWDSSLTYYSRLLPWFENADIEDDGDELTMFEVNPVNEFTLLSEKLKIKKNNWKKLSEISTQSNQYFLESTDIADKITVRSIRTNTDLVKILEVGLRELDVKLETLDTIAKVQITRKPLNFPITSPKTINNFLTDTIFSEVGAAYSRGSARSAQGLFNKLEKPTGWEMPIFSTFQQNQKKKSNMRLFSYSQLKLGETNINTNLNLSGVVPDKRNTTALLSKNNALVYFKKEDFEENNADSALNWEEHDLGSEAEIDEAVEYRDMVLRTKPKINNIKLLVDGNSKKLKKIYRNRAQDLVDNRKKVVDRMILPIQNLLFQRSKAAQPLVYHNIWRLPKNQVLSFIEKNERYREFRELHKKASALENLNFETTLALNTTVTNSGLMTLDEEEEISVESLRTSAVKPHSLYGLLWDEYLKQTYSVSLQFLDFDEKFKDIYNNQLNVLNYDYLENLEGALAPDLRYPFTINDEIKNTIIGRLLPKIGYFSEIDTPSSYLFSKENQKKKWTLRTFREYFYEGRAYRKKLKKYITERKRYGESPLGLKYDQIPHQVKLPYRKKTYWVNNNWKSESLGANLGFNVFDKLQNKNKNSYTLGRQVTSLPLSPKFKKLPKYFKNANKPEISTFLGFLGEFTLGSSLGLKNYQYDTFRAGPESVFRLKNKNNDPTKRLYRFSNLKNKPFSNSGDYYVLKNSNSTLWGNSKKQKLGRNKDMRTYIKYFLNKNNIIFTRGTDKYKNDNYFDLNIEKYKNYEIRLGREYGEFTTYLNPVTQLVRSGDLNVDFNLENLRYLKLLKSKLLQVENKTQLKPYTQIMPLIYQNNLSNNFLKTSLISPESGIQNELYSVEFYTDFLSQGLFFQQEPHYLSRESENIIIDPITNYSLDASGFFDDDEKIMFMAGSVEENRILNSEILVRNSTGPSDITRNFYTYFSLNSWDSLVLNFSDNTKAWEISNNFTIPKKIKKTSQKFPNYFWYFRLDVLLLGLNAEILKWIGGWPPKFQQKPLILLDILVNNNYLINFKTQSIVFNLKISKLLLWIFYQIIILLIT